MSATDRSRYCAPSTLPVSLAKAGVHLDAATASTRKWTPAFAGEAGHIHGSNNRRATTDTGFTLIEVIIALALFALIALAGVTLLGSVLRVQRGTQGRLERLGDEQRAMFVLADDFGSMANAPLTAIATGVEFARRTPGGPRAVRYTLADGVLQRALDHGAQVQQLLGGVTALRWQYYVRGKGWTERWPPSAEQAQAWPTAIAVDIDVAASGTGSLRSGASASSRGAAAATAGSLRRVVVLPLRPALPPPRLVLPGQAGARQGGQPGIGQLSPLPSNATITGQ